MQTTDDHEENRVYVGLGDAVEVRRPTLEEQFELEVGHDERVIVVYHTDRDPDVFPAQGTTVCARDYGVKFAPQPKDEP
jgi:hypothetical protein